jgi:beta-carotene 3-hydroxylase
MRSLLLVIGSFVAMEGISYALHRWVMHRGGMRWHASHHRPAEPGWEPNDVFPLMFSVIGVVVFLLASVGPRIQAFWWIGVGVTAYGLCYLFVHEVYIHRRVPLRLRNVRYLDWLLRSHRIHHLFGGEPYGMLLPVVSRALRSRADASDGRSDRDSARAADPSGRRVSARDTRSRL